MSKKLLAFAFAIMLTVCIASCSANSLPEISEGNRDGANSESKVQTTLENAEGMTSSLRKTEANTYENTVEFETTGLSDNYVEVEIETDSKVVSDEKTTQEYFSDAAFDKDYKNTTREEKSSESNEPTETSKNIHPATDVEGWVTKWYQ